MDVRTIECVDHAGDEQVGEDELRLGQTARLTVEHCHHHRQTAALLLVHLATTHACRQQNLPLPARCYPPVSQTARLTVEHCHDHRQTAALLLVHLPTTHACRQQIPPRPSLCCPYWVSLSIRRSVNFLLIPSSVTSGRIRPLEYTGLCVACL